MSYLKIQSVHKLYPEGDAALIDFSLELPKGQILALVGESGSGKSTLLRIVAGFENKDAGEVFLNDERIQGPKEKLVPGYDEIQLVYQEYQLYPNSTVEENIGRPLLMYDKRYKEKRVREILDLLGLMPFRNKFPKQLSGGQQQKVAIGRALSLEPEVLLLDEPFSSLDAIQRRELIEELKCMFRELGITVLFVTHDLDDALRMTEELAIIQKGRLVQKGDSESVFSSPKTMYAAKLFSHLNPVPGKTGTFIRPSEVQLFKTSGLSAKIIDRQYLIHYNQLTAILPSGETWILEDKSRSFLPGQKVYLQWRAEREIYLEL